MFRSHPRRVALALAGLLALGSVVLVGCSKSTNGSGTASDGAVTESSVGAEPSGPAVIPDSWPKAVPLYEGGTLTGADGDSTAGTYSATWNIAGESLETVAGDYANALLKAGFTATGEAVADDSSSIQEFVGENVQVTVFASTVAGADGTTDSVELFVAVDPPS